MSAPLCFTIPYAGHRLEGLEWPGPSEGCREDYRNRDLTDGTQGSGVVQMSGSKGPGEPTGSTLLSKTLEGSKTESREP